VAAAVAQLRPAHVALDGELVAVDSKGRPSSQALQHRATADLAIVYYAFDLPRGRCREAPQLTLSAGHAIE